MTNKTKTNNTKKINVTQGIRTFVKWLDANVAPIIAIPVILGLAVKGALSLFSQVNPNQDALGKEAAMVYAIAIIAFLGIKAFSR